MDGTPETLAISLLGEATFKRSRAPFDVTLPRSAMTVLAYLAIFRGEPLRRDRVAFALWPDVTDAEARANLRRQLHLLRATLPASSEPWLLVDQRTIGFNERASVTFDIDRFAHGIEAAQTRAAALELYRGDLLEEFDAEWLDEPRRRHRKLFFDAALGEARTAVERGDHARAGSIAERVLAIDPWREDVIRTILESKISSGDRAGAVSYYRDFAARLHAEFGADPDAQTTRILERIGEIVVERTIVAPMRAPLPKNLSHFINRERELAYLTTMIERHRVVTLTGPGGVGKSRLALEVAYKYGRTGEVVSVRFGSATDDSSSVEARFLEGFGIVAPREQAVDVIARFIGSQRILIFVDDADRVSTATAEFVQKLLERTTEARFLVASQRRLHLGGERILTLAPLGVPSLEAGLEEILRSESVRLFVDRARSIDAMFEIQTAQVRHIASICRRLDGMPLPIELAAARTNVLTMPEIDAKLSNRFEFLRSKVVGTNAQHRTLRATLDWSYDLLDERERSAFRRLGVFANGWTLETASAVFDDSPLDDDIIDRVSGLIEKSLVTADATQSAHRYRFLESIRLYATELLEQAGERTSVAELALQFFAGFVAERAAQFRSHLEKAAFDGIALEHDNIIALLDFAIVNSQYETAAELACNLAPFWTARGFAVDAQPRLGRLIENDTAISIPLRIRLRVASSLAYFRRGNVSEAGRLAEEALELALVVSDESLIAEALICTARCDYARENFGEARTSLDRARHFFEKLGNRLGAARALDFLAIVADASQDVNYVEDLLNRSLALFTACGDRDGIATVNYHLAFGHLKREGWNDAKILSGKAMEIWADLGNYLGENWARYNLAWAESQLGETESASRRYLKCVQTAYRFGFDKELSRGLDRLADLTLVFDAENAVKCLAYADRRRKDYGAIVIAAEMEDYDSCLQRARDRLSPASFEVAWQAGRIADERQLIDRLATIIDEKY